MKYTCVCGSCMVLLLHAVLSMANDKRNLSLNRLLIRIHEEDTRNHRSKAAQHIDMNNNRQTQRTGTNIGEITRAQQANTMTN